MENKLSKYKIDLMKHALGMDSRSPGYRNYFNTSVDSDDDIEWKKLVTLGYARDFYINDMFPGNWYMVTDKGKSLLGL